MSSSTSGEATKLTPAEVAEWQRAFSIEWHQRAYENKAPGYKGYKPDGIPLKLIKEGKIQKSLSDLGEFVVYEALRKTDYSQLPGHDPARYAPEIAKTTIQSTEQVKAWIDPEVSGWHFRRSNTLDLKPPVLERASLNVFPEEALIQKLDAFCQKHKAYYKTPHQLDGWVTRHDPITLFFQERITPEIQADLVKIVSPHARADNLFGKQIAKGIWTVDNPSKASIQALLDRAKVLDETHGTSFVESILNEDKGRFKLSAAQEQSHRIMIESFEKFAAERVAAKAPVVPGRADVFPAEPYQSFKKAVSSARKINPYTEQYQPWSGIEYVLKNFDAVTVKELGMSQFEFLGCGTEKLVLKAHSPVHGEIALSFADAEVSQKIPASKAVLQPKGTMTVKGYLLSINEVVSTAPGSFEPKEMLQLVETLKADGYLWNDVRMDNVGRRANGELVIIDLGGVKNAASLPAPTFEQGYKQSIENINHLQVEYEAAALGAKGRKPAMQKSGTPVEDPAKPPAKASPAKPEAPAKPPVKPAAKANPVEAAPVNVEPAGTGSGTSTGNPSATSAAAAKNAAMFESVSGQVGGAMGVGFGGLQLYNGIKERDGVEAGLGAVNVGTGGLLLAASSKLLGSNSAVIGQRAGAGMMLAAATGIVYEASKEKETADKAIRLGTGAAGFAGGWLAGAKVGHKIGGGWGAVAGAGVGLAVGMGTSMAGNAWIENNKKARLEEKAKLAGRTNTSDIGNDVAVASSAVRPGSMVAPDAESIQRVTKVVVAPLDPGPQKVEITNGQRAAVAQVQTLPQTLPQAGAGASTARWS